MSYRMTHLLRLKVNSKFRLKFGEEHVIDYTVDLISCHIRRHKKSGYPIIRDAKIVH